MIWEKKRFGSGIGILGRCSQKLFRVRFAGGESIGSRSEGAAPFDKLRAGSEEPRFHSYAA